MSMYELIFVTTRRSGDRSSLRGQEEGDQFVNGGFTVVLSQTGLHNWQGLSSRLVRAFNRLRLYENFYKTTSGYYGFLVIGTIFTSYYWDRMWEKIWVWNNMGKL